MGIVVATMILLLPAQTPESAAPPWNEKTTEDGRFSFAMPAPVKRPNQANTLPKGVKAQAVYYCKVDGALYSFQGITVDGPIPENARRAALDRERDEYVRSNGGKVAREERISVEGNPGWDFTLEGPAPGGSGVVTSRLRFCLVDRTYCILTVMSPRDKPLPADATRYLESFRLGKGGARAKKK
jgi:hypothetical protein